MRPASGCSFFIFPTGWYGACKNYLTEVKTMEIRMWEKEISHIIAYKAVGQEAISLHRDIIIIGRCVISVTSL